MNAIEILRTALLSDSAVAAIVGQKIRPGVLPNHEGPPAIIVNLVSEIDEPQLGSASQFYRTRLSLTCLAANADGAIQLGEACKRALEDAGNVISGVYSRFYKEGTDVLDYAADRSIHRRVLDFVVVWR